MNRTPLVVGALTAATALAVIGSATAATPRLRLDGIGPLTLGMTRTAAVATGWLAHRSAGCELASPRPVVYRVDGAKAPAGLVGSATFVNGRLRNLAFSRGVHTRLGIRPGISTTTAMVRAYRAGGYWVTSYFDATFQARFVAATRGGHTISAVASRKVVETIAVPRVEVCE